MYYYGKDNALRDWMFVHQYELDFMYLQNAVAVMDF